MDIYVVIWVYRHNLNGVVMYSFCSVTVMDNYKPLISNSFFYFRSTILEVVEYLYLLCASSHARWIVVVRRRFFFLYNPRRKQSPFGTTVHI